MSTKNARIMQLAISNNANGWDGVDAFGANHEVFADVDEVALKADIGIAEVAGRKNITAMKPTQHLIAPRITFEAQRAGAQWIPLANMFGIEVLSSDAPNEVHTWTWLDSIFGANFSMAAAIEATLPYGSGDDVIEWPALKPVSVELTPKANGFLNMEVETIGRDLFVFGDSGITTVATAFNSVTAVEIEKLICWQEVELLMNVQSAGALSSPTDRIQIDDYRVSYSRPFDRRPVARGASNGLGLTTGEPLQTGGPAEITLSFTEAAYQAIANLNDFTVEQKATMVFTATFGSTTYTLTLIFPRLQKVDNAAPITGGGTIPLERTFRLLEATSAPTGMTATFASGVLRDELATSYLLL